MEALEEAELCFPQLNNSCRKIISSQSVAIVIFTVVPGFSLVTVVLNLLVIISISHFRQLHTTTNLLLLSLAFADFSVGFLLMSIILLHLQGCWMLGDTLCAVTYFIAFLFISVSAGNIVLISVDRYIAICDPMFYTTRVTLRRVQLCICLCWIFSAVHSIWIMRDFLKHPDRYRSCYGECDVVIPYAEAVTDLVVTFFAPILIITLLYLRVFVVAVSQARAMRSHVAAVALQRSETVKVMKSEIKAARTLGVVIFVFLLCCCPYYGFSIAAVINSVDIISVRITICLLYFNSCLNPVIYAFLYPWFRKCIKQIVTLQILRPGSSEEIVIILSSIH